MFSLILVPCIEGNNSDNRNSGCRVIFFYSGIRFDNDVFNSLTISVQSLIKWLFRYLNANLEWQYCPLILVINVCVI